MYGPTVASDPEFSEPPDGLDLTTWELAQIRDRAGSRAKRSEPATALLGTYGNSPSTPGQSIENRQERRLSRHLAKRAQRRFTQSKSSSLCWMAAAANVSIDVGRSLTAHVGGVLRCGSPWACPLCAPVIRERRALDIDQGLSAALSKGYGVEFLTLTVRHHQTDGLLPRLTMMTRALGKIFIGRGWINRRDALGYLGSIRAVEITWGPANGWHPHLHAALVFDHPLTDDERAAFSSWIRARWASVVMRHGFGTINEHGVDLRSVHGANGVAEYLTKVDGGWSAGLELARSDVKSGRHGTVPATALLAEFVATGDVGALSLWREYEHATFRKQAIVWGPGLRRRLELDDLEVTDVEAAAAEGADLTLVRALIDSAEWAPIVRDGRTGELLTEVERRAGVVLGLSTMWGSDPPPLDERQSRATESA